jgi:hypothetical protein
VRRGDACSNDFPSSGGVGAWGLVGGRGASGTPPLFSLSRCIRAKSRGQREVDGRLLVRVAAAARGGVRYDLKRGDPSPSIYGRSTAARESLAPPRGHRLAESHRRG